jgi:hypothetical protein
MVARGWGSSSSSSSGRSSRGWLRGVGEAAVVAVVVAEEGCEGLGKQRIRRYIKCLINTGKKTVKIKHTVAAVGHASGPKASAAHSYPHPLRIRLFIVLASVTNSIFSLRSLRGDTRSAKSALPSKSVHGVRGSVVEPSSRVEYFVASLVLRVFSFVNICLRYCTKMLLNEQRV